MKISHFLFNSTTDVDKLYDSLFKFLNNEISKESLTRDYFLSQIYHTLLPHSPASKYFLAKIYYLMDFWSQAEKFANEAIELLEKIETRSVFHEKVLKDMYFCKGKMEQYLNKPKEIEETVQILQNKSLEYRQLGETIQTLGKSIQSELQKYVQFSF